MLLILLFRQEALAALLAGSFALLLHSFSGLVLDKGFIWALTYPWRGLTQRFKTAQYFTRAPQQIQDGYKEAAGSPFAIQSPGVHITFVSDLKRIEEIDSAPKDVLSLQGAAKVLLSPQQSMHNFDWKEYKGADGAPLMRTLRGLLRHDLPLILPKTRVRNDMILNEIVDRGGNALKATEMIRSTVVHITAVAFFGDQMAKDKKFLDIAIIFAKEVVLFTEVTRILPKLAVPAVTALLKLRFNSQKTFFEYLEVLAQERIDERDMSQLGQKIPEHRDCIQWVMEQSSKLRPWTADTFEPWKAGRIAHELMALWFGAIHGMTMTLLSNLQDICLHPEYVETLRQELESPAYEVFEATGKGLPLLDSFIKESGRLNPLDQTSTRRKALKQFTFSDGLTIQPDQWVCTPAAAMMRDPRLWAEADTFHGFRHVNPATLKEWSSLEHFTNPEPEKASPLTDINSWQTWGTGRNACPGRYFVAAALKQILGLIITKYDCLVVNNDAKRKFSWRSCNVPSECMQIILQPRTSMSTISTKTV